MLTTSNLSKFAQTVANSATKINQLDFIHTTTAYNIVDIINSGTIEARDRCKVLGGLYIYFFYGRADYIPDTKSNARKDPQYRPCALILNAENYEEKIGRLFPIDTGGFCRTGGPLSKYFHHEVRLDDLELPNEINFAKKCVKFFYGSNKNYLNYKPKKAIPIPKHDFIAKSYHDMIRNEYDVEMDSRASTIEIAIENKLNISGIKGLVLPNYFLNSAFAKTAKGKYGLKVKYYPSDPKDPPSNFASALKRKVKSIVESEH